MSNQQPPSIVVTTIQDPTSCMKTLAQTAEKVGSKVTVVGDRKGPFEYPLEACELLTIDDQIEMEFELVKLLPENHYTRKNVGYLKVILEGATFIYETDDDNAPTDWDLRSLSCEARKPDLHGWVNVYRWFSDELIWPRGLPLDTIKQEVSFEGPITEFEAPIQQGLADGSPDVDAIWRLVLDKDIKFEKRDSIVLPRGAWCPFNSQSTWWWPVAYPLMYLPSYCSFRMTDIWRSFVAQRCLWELGTGLVFHASEVHQERNVHNLQRDFEMEVDGYLQNARIAEALENLALEPGSDAVATNLYACYEELVKHDFFPEKELPLVSAWISDLKAIE
ncbi:MAG: hypothetical protein CMO55_07365 [Verrucomicrobiales bacterium]|nr:hypothetical protein [Verrucomicrobiales bacterium]